MLYTFTPTRHDVDYTANQTQISFSIQTRYPDISIRSISIPGIKSTYEVVDPDEPSVKRILPINLVLLIGGQQYGEAAEVKDSTTAVFEFESPNYYLISGNHTSVTFTIQISGTGTFGISGYIDSSLAMPSGAGGFINSSVSNIPPFSISYVVPNEEIINKYRRNTYINIGYPFLRNLPTDFSDYDIPLENDWLIDDEGIINIGYPFLKNLPTDFSDYVEFFKTVYPIIAIYVVKKKSI